MSIWNPWHGCHKISAGCMNCYVYRRDASIGKAANVVTKTASFALPVARNRKGVYKLQEADVVYTCMSSDFFVEEADPWREEIWAMIRERKELRFCIITKRIERFRVGLPSDWGDGYDNVTIFSTCENQKMTDQRLAIMLSLPIKQMGIIHEPMLEAIHIADYLVKGSIKTVICGGESGSHSRLCDYDWVLHTRRQCIDANVTFYFKQTGRLFRKDGLLYTIPRSLQMEQARKAAIDFSAKRSV